MTTETPRTTPSTPEDLLEMPENHLDVVVTPDSLDSSRRASLRTRLIAVISMPLFFLVAFSLCYVSATHAPSPHDMGLTIAGPAAVTEQLTDAVNDKAAGAFDITQTTDAAAARESVANRDSVGAVIIDGATVTVVVASAGSRLAAQVVESVATPIATQLGATVTVDDVAPLPADDPSGTVLFFYLIICTIGAFLSITVISQAIRKGSLRSKLFTAVGAGIVVPVLGFAMISLFVDFGVTFGTAAGVIGVGMIYTFTVALLATLFTLLLGQAAVLAEILFLVALNFPSAGGSVPMSMLPPFWQVVHNTWVGAGGLEAMRSILYFDGAQAGRWILQLLIWLVVVIVLIAVVSVVKKRRAAAQSR
ncbi:hypothetical protein [Subtercola endophyticus]|uniref:hypothetical protein n=1 Tax=Subtercola endophyticus TaxID=2895559 RepID=UPI001E3C457E|nr:hypothetical protein [Subtercola endophyticus]UFS58193.1 hypothetical protein LQ955_14375 [Subtercola endophyticus]